MKSPPLLPLIGLRFGLLVGATLLLSVPHACADETRGTQQGAIVKKQLVLRDRAGNLHEFNIAKAEVVSGLRQRPIDESLLNVGARLLVIHDGHGNAQRVVGEWVWYEFPALWIDETCLDFSDWYRHNVGPGFLSEYFNVTSLLAVLFVGLICGVISSLVVSNRMAFFSDALAHCAFAGAGLGLLLAFAELILEPTILAVMIGFGAFVGLAIAYVREQTSLASDTVIGVFFAGAMGFGAVLLQFIGRRGRFNPENFVFGSPLSVTGQDIIHLLLLLIVLIALLCWLYNRLVFISFNPSLARSRNFPVRLANYVFIVLLALVVNISLKLVGALLINALLILPAAAAANISRNLRQFFWISVVLSLVAGLSGLILSAPLHQGPGGMIVILGVAFFFVSMLLGRWLRGARGALRTSF